MKCVHLPRETEVLQSKTTKFYLLGRDWLKDVERNVVETVPLSSLCAPEVSPQVNNQLFGIRRDIMKMVPHGEGDFLVLAVRATH